MRYFVLLLSLILLSACSTTYGPKGPTGGYSELQVSDNVYRINVSGNGYTSQETVQSFALLRASELTLAAGKQRFVILDDKVDSQSEVYSSGFGSSTTNVYGSTAYTTYSSPTINTVTRAGGVVVIEIIEEQDPRFGTAYDARLLDRQLRPVLVKES